MWEQHCLAQLEATDVNFNAGWYGITGTQAVNSAPYQIGKAVLFQTWTSVLTNDLACVQTQAGFGVQLSDAVHSAIIITVKESVTLRAIGDQKALRPAGSIKSQHGMAHLNRHWHSDSPFRGAVHKRYVFH